jgi:hypothetical protein
MRLILSAMVVLLASQISIAQTTQPALSNAALELRATQAFNGNKFAEALPMLRQLASDLKADPAQTDKVAMIQEQIRVCQKNLDTKPVAAAPKTVARARTPHPAPVSGQVLETTITELGNFDFDPENGSPIPDDVKALSGNAIRLSGYMVPLDQAENISRFALVPSLAACPCMFGGPPQIQHTIVVTCPRGKAVEYYSDEIVVQGKLTVDVVKDEGYIVSIFALETTSVKPVAK